MDEEIKSKVKVIFELFKKAKFEGMTANDCADVVSSASWMYSVIKPQEIKIDEPPIKQIEAPKPKGKAKKVK